jgi:hypothetical protein
MKSNTQCDVLLVTVTDVETEALLKTAKTRTGCEYKTELGNQKTYFDLGMIGGARVFAVRSEMGSDTLGGSLLTVRDAIEEVKPSAVIMVGIAFGIIQGSKRLGRSSSQSSFRRMTFSASAPQKRAPPKSFCAVTNRIVRKNYSTGFALLNYVGIKPKYISDLFFPARN